MKKILLFPKLPSLGFFGEKGRKGLDEREGKNSLSITTAIPDNIIKSQDEENAAKH